MEALTKEECKHIEDEEARQQAATAAAEAERQRQEEEDHRNLNRRGRRVHQEILQTRMGDQNVFTTPQQNILVAKALYGTIEPMLAEDHATTPIITWIKAMVTEAAI